MRPFYGWNAPAAEEIGASKPKAVPSSESASLEGLSGRKY